MGGGGFGDGLADVAEALAEVDEDSDEAIDGIDVAVTELRVAVEGLFDAVPAFGFLGGENVEHFSELEEVGLGAGGCELGGRTYSSLLDEQTRMSNHWRVYPSGPFTGGCGDLPPREARGKQADRLPHLRTAHPPAAAGGRVVAGLRGD